MCLLQRKGESWACRKDAFFVGKFKDEYNLKDGFYPVDCRNPREHRVIEFLLPILYSEKPKRLSIMMANTIFGVLSGTRPVKSGWLIWELVEKLIPTLARKPLFSPPIFSTSTNITGVSTRRKKRLGNCGGRGCLQVGTGYWNNGGRNRGIVEQTCHSQATSCRTHPWFEKDGCSSAPKRRRSKSGNFLEGYWFVLLWVSETPFKRVREMLTSLQNQYFRL